MNLDEMNYTCLLLYMCISYFKICKDLKSYNGWKLGLYSINNINLTFY